MASLENRSSYPDIPNPRGDDLIRFCTAFTATAGVAVAFRIGIRAKRKLLGWDDFWIGISLIFSILLMVSIIIGVDYGFGLHSEQVSNKQKEMAMFWWYLNQMYYKSIVWPTKLSILLMYRRVFLVGDNVKAYGVQFRTLIWVTLAVVISCYVSFQTAGIFQCTPIRRSWNPSTPGNCTNAMARMYAHAGCNFVTDVVILLLPMPLINGLTHISKRQRLGLMCVFAVGGFVSLTTILRISKLQHTSDVLYSARDSFLWTIVEANTGIICACLPLMRSVLIYLLPCLRDRASPKSQSRHWIGEVWPTAANKGREDKQDCGRCDIFNDKDDAFSTSCIEEVEIRSLDDSEVGIIDRILKRVDIEALPDSTAEDCKSQIEYGDRRAS